MASVTRRGKNGRARRGTVELHIFEAVERLLADGESYTTLGVQRIADEAGIARSSFYLNFSDKVDLLMRLSDAVTTELFGLAERWLAEPHLDPPGFEQALVGVIREYRRHAGTLMALAEVAAYDPDVARFWRERVDRFAAVWQGRVEEDQRTGVVDADLDAARTIDFVAWALEGAVSRHVADGRPEDDDPILAAVVGRVVWRAIYGDR